MGIETYFNLWNYFRARIHHGLGAEAAALGNMDIFVGSGRGVDPYFHPLTSGPSDRWGKV
jgi:hypothetical protein